MVLEEFDESRIVIDDENVAHGESLRACPGH
jgi:hypothetical protein